MMAENAPTTQQTQRQSVARLMEPSAANGCDVQDKQRGSDSANHGEAELGVYEHRRGDGSNHADNAHAEKPTYLDPTSVMHDTLMSGRYV